MESLIFIFCMISFLIIAGIAAIILDDMDSRKNDYYDELERKVKKK